MFYSFTRAELKKHKATDFKTGDRIKVGKYLIEIDYGIYDTPIATKVSVYNKPFNYLSCTAGVNGGTPYYIDDFKNRR